MVYKIKKDIERGKDFKVLSGDLLKIADSALANAEFTKTIIKKEFYQYE